MRVLITGATGFAGGHLADAILRQGDSQIIGVARSDRWPSEWEHLAGKVALRVCNLCDKAAVESLIGEIRPDQVYHLAGYAHVGESFREPDAAWAGNLTATRYVYEAIESWGGKPRVVSVGSGLVYGDADASEAGPDEQAPLRPLSPYAASKAAADLVGYQFARAGGLAIVRVRPSNHIGPRQSPEYAVAHFAKQIAAIEAGQQQPLLETGNLSPRRDLTDVRDMVQAYMLLMKHGRAGEVYNAGMGEARSMQEVVDHLLALARLPIRVHQTADLVRATETKVVCTNAAKLRRETGWAPQYTFEQTLADILGYFRDRLRRQPA